jgi:integrase
MTLAHVERRVRNGRVSYPARYRDPAGREHGRVFARKVDAQRFLTEMENAKLRGIWTNPALGRVLFEQWFVEWRRTTASLRPNTEARDERLFRLHLLPRFGAMPLAGIGQREVRAWVADLTEKGLAPSTVQRAYQLLTKVMAAAVDAGMIPQSPCRRVPLPKIERQEMRFLSPAEIWKLADAIRPDYRALILLGAFGGLRIGEMAGLRRGRVDLERGTVQVIEVITEPKGRLHFGPPKTRAGRRMVGLPRFVVDALAERMAAPGTAEDLVFAGPHGGALRVTLFRQRFWLPAVKAAGLDGLRIHDLRHTAVALWIAAGANPKEVAARAGHASVSFTLDRYGHLYPEADLTLRERLDAIWSASGGGR